MKVSELVAILLTMPQDLPVEVNNNRDGIYSYIEQVDLFIGEQYDEIEPAVVIQVEVD